MRAAILALAVLFVADSPSTAQEAMEARPGTVMTLIVRPPADLQEGHDPEDDLVLGYAIEAAGGFQLVGSRSGAFTWLAGEEGLPHVLARDEYGLLVGVQVHAQGLSIDGAAPNSVGATSNGVTLEIGSR